MGVVLAGCSSFDAKYAEVAARGAAPADGIEGAWDGRWQSQAGHGGDRLRAIVTKTGPDTYHAWFRARFWGVFEASQEVDLQARPAGLPGTVQAAGEADLGWLAGGVYRYEAAVSAEKFYSTYSSKYDHGEFDLGRPK